MYSAFVKEDRAVRSILRGEKTASLEAVSWLKKLCMHPILIENQGDALADVLKGTDVDAIVGQSAKLEHVRAVIALSPSAPGFVHINATEFVVVLLQLVAFTPVMTYYKLAR
jgi:hypothetical protein